MSKDRIIEILEDKLQHQQRANIQLADMLSTQSNTIEQLSHQITILQQSLVSLEKALLEKNSNIEKLLNQNRGLGKLISNKSEKQTVHKQPVISNEQDNEFGVDILDVEKPPRKGNNNAKRKEFYNLDVEYKHIFPSQIGFDPKNYNDISTTESIRYKCTPMCFTKVITQLHTCRSNGNIYSAKAPTTPQLNSNYDASFIAGMLQLRYIYSMPVERVVKFFAENNFQINKSTAHSLLRKSALLLERFEDVMKAAVLEDHYIGMDESYHRVLVQKSRENDKGSIKGYIWCALAMTKKLLHFFYDNGSRGKEVFLNFLPTDYKGAISSDGLQVYKRVETDDYPNAIRLSCFQHCKRYFLDIESDPDAREIIDLINRLYQADHKIDSAWSDGRKLRFRQKHAQPLLSAIKLKLDSINSRSPLENPPKSTLAIAVKHMLSEFSSLSNYTLRPEYRLDNNAIERAMRYISLSRKNSLFAGSHQGAKRSALFYSLACSCRLHNINTFDYFTDILNKMATFTPNVTNETLRELLPDSWVKQAISENID